LFNWINPGSPEAGAIYFLMEVQAEAGQLNAVQKYLSVDLKNFLAQSIV
jgi:hypothetical protein